MSRIRSTHPGQWTDEKFVCCTALARLLAIALRNFSDDHGVFEWTPLKIKMLCLPGDNCDIEALLEELKDSGQVSRYENGGRSYGLIRNFMRYQRPQKPKYLYPVPAGFNTDTELIDAEPPSVRDQYDTNQVNPPQRKEEGSTSSLRSEVSDADASGGGPPPDTPADPIKELWDRGLMIVGDTPKGRAFLGKLRKEYRDVVVMGAIADCEAECPSEPLAYLMGCCEQRRRSNGQRGNASAGHARALDILGQAARDADERQGNRGGPETAH